MKRGYSIALSSGKVLRLTGNHEVYLANGTAVAAERLRKGDVVVVNNGVKIEQVDMDAEEAMFYNVECDGGVEVEGVKCK